MNLIGSEKIVVNRFNSALSILLIKNFVLLSQTYLIALDLKNFEIALFLELINLVNFWNFLLSNINLVLNFRAL